MKEAVKIVFLGTPEFAVDSLDVLTSNGFDIAAVVTSPDQPAGRGQLLQSSPIKKYAQSKGIRVLQPEKLKNPDFLAELQSLQGDLFIVVAFRMLPEAVWAMPRLGTFNLHASLLPQYRGAAPINHAIMNGETETGLTTFFLKQEIDTGEIIFQEKIAIGPDETAGELHDRMKVAGAQLVLKTTRAIQEDNLHPVEQGKLIDAANPLKPAPKIFREDCLIDWTKDTVSIFNKIRGLSPYPAAHTFFISPGGESHMVKIYRAEKAGSVSGFGPGHIITDGKTGLSITTIDGSIHIRALQQAGKKALGIGEFLRGFRINTDWTIGYSSV